jgi:hypothetical protein
MSTDLWLALGTGIATLVFLVMPVVVYAYDLLETLIVDPETYARAVAVVESGEKYQSGSEV